MRKEGNSRSKTVPAIRPRRNSFDIRELKQRRRAERQRERQKLKGLRFATQTNLHVYHAFFQLSLPCRHCTTTASA